MNWHLGGSWQAGALCVRDGSCLHRKKPSGSGTPRTGEAACLLVPTLTVAALPLSTPQDPKVTADRAFNGFGTNFENSPEPIYGTQFLPRKFKIAVTVPGDNSVDIFTNDLGVVVMCDEKGELQASDAVLA